MSGLPLGIPVIGWIGARDGSLRSLLRIRRVSRSSRQQTCVGLSHASRSRMDDALKTAVAAGFVTFSYPAGSQLYAKGAVCEETHILLSGESAASTYPDFHLRIPPHRDPVAVSHARVLTRARQVLPPRGVWSAAPWLRAADRRSHTCDMAPSLTVRQAV